MTEHIQDILRRNLHEVFGEHDADKRQRVIAALWEPDGIFIDPKGQHVGVGALNASISALHAQFPTFVFSELAAPQGYHGIGRLSWGFGPVGEPPKATGVDIVVMRGEKIGALYTFLDSA